MSFPEKMSTQILSAYFQSEQKLVHQKKPKKLIFIPLCKWVTIPDLAISYEYKYSLKKKQQENKQTNKKTDAHLSVLLCQF